MRRLLLLALTSLCLIATALPVVAQSTVPPETTSTEQWIATEIHQFLNDERTTRGLDPLPWAQDLSDRAAAWSAEMARSGNLTHSSTEFRTLDGWYGAAENIFRGGGSFASSGASNRAFMNSDGHRSNMLNPSHDAAGIGVVCRDGTLWVTHLLAQTRDEDWQPRPDGTPPPSPTVHASDGEGTNCGSPRSDAAPQPSPMWPGSATPEPSGSSYARLAGDNRFATAAQAVDPAATRLVIASGGDWPDALAAATLAGPGTAVLLVERDRVPAETDAASRQLAVGEIVVMGGPAAVSNAVVQDLQAIHPGAAVRRLAGPTRTQTAVEAAREAADRSTVVVADAGEVFDALVAAASSLGPLLLADPATGLPDEALALLADSGTRRAMLIGGATGNDRLAEQLSRVRTVDLGSGPVDQLSAAVAQRVHDAPADAVLLASGASWPDTLTAAALAVRDQQPLLLGAPDGSTDWSAFEAYAPTAVRVVGGPAALPDSALP